MTSDFTPAEHANFAAATMVAHATAFLDGRAQAETLQDKAKAMLPKLILIGEEDSRTKDILAVTQLLVIASLNASATKDAARLDRWQSVMGALVELARMEAKKLRETGAQRS